jgi:hypothetical protein
MTPSEVSASLLQLASYIEVSRSPSLSFLASRLAVTLLATDRTLSESVGKALAEKVAKLMPTEFDGSTYDTSDRGKGFKGGYISWAMDPNTWEAAGIIGGILFSCAYDPSEFSSEAPEEGAQGSEEWKGHSKGGAAITLNVECGYYNKRYGGGVQDRIPLGTCTVLLDAREKITEADIDDPETFKAGVAGLIRKINDSPPDEAVSEGRRRKALPPSTSPASLLRWLEKNNRTDVSRSEINELVKSVSERTDKAPGTVLEKVNQFFRSRGWPINERA